MRHDPNPCNGEGATRHNNQLRQATGKNQIGRPDDNDRGHNAARGDSDRNNGGRGDTMSHKGIDESGSELKSEKSTMQEEPSKWRAMVTRGGRTMVARGGR